MLCCVSWPLAWYVCFWMCRRHLWFILSVLCRFQLTDSVFYCDQISVFNLFVMIICFTVFVHDLFYPFFSFIYSFLVFFLCCILVFVSLFVKGLIIYSRQAGLSLSFCLRLLHAGIIVYINAILKQIYYLLSGNYCLPSLNYLCHLSLWKKFKIYSKNCRTHNRI